MARQERCRTQLESRNALFSLKHVELVKSPRLVSSATSLAVTLCLCSIHNRNPSWLRHRLSPCPLCLSVCIMLAHNEPNMHQWCSSNSQSCQPEAHLLICTSLLVLNSCGLKCTELLARPPFAQASSCPTSSRRAKQLPRSRPPLLPLQHFRQDPEKPLPSLGPPPSHPPSTATPLAPPGPPTSPQTLVCMSKTHDAESAVDAGQALRSCSLRCSLQAAHPSACLPAARQRTG
eukprot:scaffold102462_cov16-Tisochrysis_lutea.AAC.2